MRAAVWLLLSSAPSFAAVFTVANVHDSGPGSLRQAILDSNAAGGPNIIEFSMEGAPPYVIKIQGEFLPPLKGPVMVRMKPAPEPAAPSPAPDGGRGGRGGRGAAAVHREPLAPTVILDGSALVQPRTPAACPGATYNYDFGSGKWQTSDVKGSGANVRGYFGAGLAVQDSHDVEISGIEIRNFCIGVASVRSHDVNIHDVKIVDMHGAAGVIFTGDDGKSGRTDLSFHNRLMNSILLDNGDGFEFTRGTHDSLIQGNTITLTQPLPEDGNAIEFAQAGDNNAIIGNTFSKYVDTAVTTTGNHHTIRDNKFISNKGDGLRTNGANLIIEGNLFTDNGGSGMIVGGEGTRVLDNAVTENGGKGIVVTTAGVELSRNSIHDNAHLGIDIGAAGGERGGAAGPGRGGPTGAARGPAPQRTPSRDVSEIPDAPVISSASSWSADGIVLNGTVSGKPNRNYQVELFASPVADRHAGEEHGWGEGELYLGAAFAHADASGKAAFLLPLTLSDLFGGGKTTAYFTATATDSTGSTSKFSRALQLTKAGASKQANQQDGKETP